MPLSRCNILIVEDQAIIALDLESAVEESNGQVIGPASTVREALKLLHTNEVDAAILCKSARRGRDAGRRTVDRGRHPISHQYRRRRSPPASAAPWSNGLSKAHAFVTIGPRVGCAPADLQKPRGVVAHSRERLSGSGHAVARTRALFLVKKLELRERHLLWLVRFSLGLKLQQSLLLHPLINAHGFRVASRCSGRFFGHRFSRSIAASLLLVGVLDGDLSIPEREHVTALDLNTNAVVPSA